jgi:endonuclease/exonuclease/phosphatase family metal-dependent hydrolase
MLTLRFVLTLAPLLVAVGAASEPRPRQARSVAATAPAARQSPGSAALGAFSSPEHCAELAQQGERLPRARGQARFVSWNLHWFPDGEAASRGRGVELSWLACVLWWLDADVIAVQEVKQTPRAVAAMQQLLAELDRSSGGRYTVRLDECGSRVPQHVGLLVNERRVAVSDVRTVAELNPSGEACGRQLRPGLSARLRFPGGLDLTAVSVHFKSKADERALDLRENSFSALPAVLERVTERAHDDDLLVLGDLNTMGCDECEPPLSAHDELLAADTSLRRRGLRVVAADSQGTFFYHGRLTPLDHVVASQRMRELEAGARVHVSGPCASSALGGPRGTGAAEKQRRLALSDHCPIVLDLTDRDLD